MIRLREKNQVYRNCSSVRYRAEAIMSEALDIKVVKDRDYKDFSELAREQAKAELRQDLWNVQRQNRKNGTKIWC